MVTKTVALSGIGTWTVPADCNVAVAATVYGIGAGGGGGRGYVRVSGGGGGGGGAYATTTVTLPAIGNPTYYSTGTGGTPGQSNGSDGADGTDTWFNIAANSAPLVNTNGVVAKGGVGGKGYTFLGGAGGDSGGCIGATVHSGGAGGQSWNTSYGGSQHGGGGGGSSGSSLGVGGAGANGQVDASSAHGGSGGSGGGVGGPGSTPTSRYYGADGGLTFAGATGGLAPGGTGSDGGGGASTPANVFYGGGLGGAGDELVIYDGSTRGAGGGGGGSGGGDTQNSGGVGGAGGLYGGGGAGSGGINWSHNSITFDGGYGADGVVVITYTVLAAGATSRVDSLLVQAVLGRFQDDLGRVAQDSVRGWTIDIDGHSFYVLYLAEEGCLVYDQSTKNWYEWNSWTPVDSTAPFRGRCGWNWGPDKIVGDDNLGLLWDLTNEEYTDEAPYSTLSDYDITAVLTGGLPTFGRNTQHCAGVFVESNASTSDLVGKTIQLETSDDQGETYQDQGTITFVNDVTQDIQWMSLGRINHPLRVFRFTDNGLPRIDEVTTWTDEK